ncbi:2-polyprenyl-3-methyl-6-methoxy-1,4-benzoquinone monooxygenase [Pusillimonas sp. CC-YST705]|uniref:3-demethoxyubiquinol 3-hydroxylase n=1 Tax=Mesopusillimonas faecipullorum TaxID=2755040 RepID=A0ABS8CBU1_9BURK|nr:2-polyprenyl-3-methyl-6-methoxy-1,4-benzoquinone monooxygenase [Mesopusillimonas faecipullorum]MCB5363494.1 2-polyprenyl-3-methyl-6-methoxy-1,4-benzoquinone monooxygenase [Mesopusillimonas faecipullorum]
MSHKVHAASLSAGVRRFSRIDDVLTEAGRALRILAGAAQAGRPNPAAGGGAQAKAQDAELSTEQRRHAAGLMRVNHVGEVCAQALYRGQALGCQDASVREVFQQAAAEEVDHLAWCDQRLKELDSRPSYLNPVWYAGSFALGALASRAGTGLNLGFMAETERQVSDHLDSHLRLLPAQDHRSRRIVEQMRQDEDQHRSTAEQHGGRPLPFLVKRAMKLMSRVMTATAYRI